MIFYSIRAARRGQDVPSPLPGVRPASRLARGCQLLIPDDRGRQILPTYRDPLMQNTNYVCTSPCLGRNYCLIIILYDALFLNATLQSPEHDCLAIILTTRITHLYLYSDIFCIKANHPVQRTGAYNT